LVLVVVAVLIAALVSELSPQDSPQQAAPAAVGDDAGQDAAALAGPRRQAALDPCPAPGQGPGPALLKDVVVQCAADGSPVDVGRALAGRTVVLNLWAYWCGPCADELPAMAEYQRRAGPAVTVVTVHQDRNAGAGLLRLAELGVRLPTLQDPDRKIAAALSVPNVMPATVLLRADGTVAKILPRSFANADDIAAAVHNGLT